MCIGGPPYFRGLELPAQTTKAQSRTGSMPLRAILLGDSGSRLARLARTRTSAVRVGTHIAHSSRDFSDGAVAGYLRGTIRFLLTDRRIGFTILALFIHVGSP